MVSFSQQISTDSLSEWPDQDPLRLPYGPASHILNYLPPQELVNVCMLVSRRWLEFLSDITFWKSKMKQDGNYSDELNSITDINWPKLYLKTIYKPNLIKSFDEDGKLSFTHWRTSSTAWEHFKMSKKIVWNGGGGNKWDIEISINPEVDSDLFEDNMFSVHNYVTSYNWCCREQVVCLANMGLSAQLMDQVQPELEISEWFCARFDCGSHFCIRVELLDAEKKVVEFFERTETTEQWLGGELGWRKIQHVFTGYGAGVRYLRFADAGKDTQFWAGHYGSKMAGAWARVNFNL